MSENRLHKAVRNIFWRFIVLLMTVVANLIIPRYIILIYGSEVNGLTSSITHVLSIVNLIQAGLGSSVTYLMYKPIEERDRATLASILISAKRIYKYISMAVLALGTGACIIFAYAVKTDLPREFVLIASLLTCINSAASTYFTAASNIFLGAKQDGYLTSRITIFTNILSYVLNILVIIFKPHFIVMYVNNMIICVVNIIALSNCFNKRYEPFAPTEEEQKLVKRIPIRGVSYAAANEAAHAVINGATTVVLSMFASLKAASIYGVYMIAVGALNTLSNAIYTAVVPSYGSVAAEGNMEKTNRIFEIYQFVLFTLNTLLYMCAAYLLIPFVKLYTNGVTDAEYTNIPLMILVVSSGIISNLRIPYNNTVYIKGLFKQTYLQPVICAIITLGLMVGLTIVDFSYMPLAGIFFQLANTFYQHFKLPKLFPGFDNHRFWNHLAVMACGLTIAFAAFFAFPVAPSNFIWWFVYGCITGVVSLVVLSALLLLLDRKSLLNTMHYFISRKKSKS